MRMKGGAMSRLHVVSVFAMFAILLMPAAAAPQAAVGMLLGNVRDDSGAAVPGATITAVECAPTSAPMTRERTVQNSSLVRYLRPCRADGECANVDNPDAGEIIGAPCSARRGYRMANRRKACRAAVPSIERWHP
jgi:hypothetical protein